MKFIREYKSSILLFIVAYIFLFGSYYLLAVGIPNKTFYLQMRRYIPCALGITISTALWIKMKLNKRGLIPYAIVGLIWTLVFPVCDWLCLHKSVTFLDNHFDAAFGAYLYACTVSLRIVLFRYEKYVSNITIRFLMSIVHTGLLIIPIVQFLYYMYYKVSITPAACVAFIQTNNNEAKEFISQSLGTSGVVAVVVGFLLLLVTFYFLNGVKVHAESEVDNVVVDNKLKQVSFDKTFNAALQLCKIQTNLFKMNIFILATVIALVTGIYANKIFMLTGVMNSYAFAKQYYESAEMFKKYHKDNFDKLVVTPSKPQFSKPSTIILVIGESASRTFMSAYNHDLKNDTTPWMRKVTTEDNNNFLLFKHAYTSWQQTVPSLERALTEKNQYNTKEFNQSITILDIAKKAGYDTYWFSAQGTISDADTPITLVAETADHAKWLEDSQSNRENSVYDGDLIKFLKDVDPNKNNFVVIHVMGSHDRFFNRYPVDFTRFGDKNPEDYPVTYDNSLAYTDWVLEKIYEYGTNKLNLQAMVYFSDHGADPFSKRMADRSPFVSLRVPFFIYLSDEYEDKYPIVTEELKKHENSYFTNDLLYETMCGVFGIKSNHYDEAASLTSNKYKFNRENLTTRLGKNKLSEDVEEK